MRVPFYFDSVLVMRVLFYLDSVLDVKAPIYSDYILELRFRHRRARPILFRPVPFYKFLIHGRDESNCQFTQIPATLRFAS